MGLQGRSRRRFRLRLGRRLTVGTDEWQWQHPPASGHGRVWCSVLAHLDVRVDFAVRAAGAQLPPEPSPDVWLADGHRGDPQVRGPVVAFVHEVGWGTPEQDQYLAEGYPQRMEQQTRAAVARAARVITASQCSKQQIVRAYGVAEERVHVVPHGVDRSIFR